MRQNLLSVVICFTILCSSNFVQAQPDAEAMPLISGLTQPTDLACPADGSNRLFVTEKSGHIKIIQDQKLIGTFVDLSAKVSTNSERGLLGLAFHPEYATNGFFYINYTGLDTNGTFYTIISRLKVSTSNPNMADPNSEVRLLTFSQPYSNHNGGDMAFGPDGYLYIATGDGGSAGDPQNNSQNLGNLLGKILRIDINSGSAPYLIPTSNPFVGQAGASPEIWAYGLRNPWRISFDRATGNLWIADVGQGVWEEINVQPSGQGGQNYGWRCFEGNAFYSSCGSVTHTGPQYEYAHPGAACMDTTFCGRSITGGFVYRGNQYPALSGYYFFADYVDKRLWAMNIDTGVQVIRQPQIFLGGITTFGENESGEVFFATLSGTIYQLISNQVLPVTMVSYELESNDKNYELSWETYDEIDLEQYLIETSTDLETIQIIHREPAIGHARNIYRYRGVTNSPLLYIRITAVDLDGTKEHFPWKSIQLLPDNDFQWFPNPSYQSFRLNYSGPLRPDHLRVYNAQGQNVRIQFEIINDQIHLNLGGQPAGLYFIHVKNDTLDKIQKVILQSP